MYPLAVLQLLSVPGSIYGLVLPTFMIQGMHGANVDFSPPRQSLSCITFYTMVLFAPWKARRGEAPAVA